MGSPFEKSAQQAAVESVERRWAAKHPAARRPVQTGTRMRLFAAVGLLAVTLVAGTLMLNPLRISLPDLTQTFVDLRNAERDGIDLFMSELQTFGTDDVLPWKSAPQEVRPKRAPGGFTYRMLIETPNGTCGLYQMVADGKGRLSVSELSPIGHPLDVSLADFNRARRDSAVYLIACGGKVYVCGSDDPEEGRAFARRMGACGRAD